MYQLSKLLRIYLPIKKSNSLLLLDLLEKATIWSIAQS